MEATAQTRMVFQVCLAVTVVKMAVSIMLSTQQICGVPRRLVQTLGPVASIGGGHSGPSSAATSPALIMAIPSAASKTPSELYMKTNDTPTFVSDIDLCIIPSTITKQLDGSHKVQLSLKGTQA